MSGRLSDEQLAEIREREQAATPGPWEPYPQMGPSFVGYVRGEYLRGVGDLAFGEGEQAEADRAFVLAARTDVPALLAEVAEQRARADHAEAAHDERQRETANLADTLRDTQAELRLARAEVEQQRAAEQRLRALHPKREDVTHGCCASPKVCTVPHPPVCMGASHGLDKPVWPCAEMRALDGGEVR